MTMLKRFNRNFFDTNIRYLRYVLLWPPEESGLKRMIYTACFGTSFTGTVLLMMLSEMIELLTSTDNYDQIIRTLSCFMLHVIYLYKIVSWFKDAKKAKLCIKMLYRKSFNFEDFEQASYNFTKALKEMSYFVDERFDRENIAVHTENLEKFWERNKLSVKQNKHENCKIKLGKLFMKDVQEEITTETNIHCCLVIIIIYFLILVAIGFMYGGCIFESIVGLVSGKLKHISPIPEDIYFPINSTDINTYTTICIYQTIVAIYVSSQFIGVPSIFYHQKNIRAQLNIFLGIDFFFWSILIHLDGQVRVIEKALESVSTETDVQHICKMDVQFSKCMYELQQTINLLEVLKDMYSIPLLLQYLFVIVVSCCVLYSMSQEDNVFLAIGLIGFAGCALANSFFNIFYITELTHQFAAVPNAIYSINWPGTNVRFQKKILFAMARMQKVVGIEMGGMIAVDLNVFNKILQTTYSFFTLLKTKNSN